MALCGPFASRGTVPSHARRDSCLLFRCSSLQPPACGLSQTPIRTRNVRRPSLQPLVPTGRQYDGRPWHGYGSRSSHPGTATGRAVAGGRLALPGCRGRLDQASGERLPPNYSPCLFTSFPLLGVLGRGLTTFRAPLPHPQFTSPKKRGETARRTVSPVANASRRTGRTHPRARRYSVVTVKPVADTSPRRR